MCRQIRLDLIIFASIIVLLNACGGGGGGGGGSNKPGGSTLTMKLGTPATEPSVIPPSADTTQVTFLAMVTGSAMPPASVQLDELNPDGTVSKANVAQLYDDGNDADYKRGDRIYSGTLDIGNADPVEKNYRISTTFNGKTISSNPMNFWVSGCPATSRPSDPSQAVFDATSGGTIFANEVMLRMNADVAPNLDTINTTLSNANVVGHVVGCIPAQREYLVEITNPNKPADAKGVYSTITDLKKQSGVADAFPNGQALAQPFSPLTNSLLCNGLVDATCQWYLHTIRATKAWQLAGGGDPQMSVAEIDFGVDCTLNALPCDAMLNHQDPIDHGTGVAGVIASPNNPTGMVGAAYNTYLYPYDILSSSGSLYKMSELINAATSQADVRVINISAGTGADFGGEIKNAVCHAIGSGRLVVAAAGNPVDSADTNCELNNVFPASLNSPNVSCDNGADLQSGLLVVGATDIKNNLAHWDSGTVKQCSNKKYVNVYAPGKDIVTLSTEYGYTTKSGTSFAAPLVSGAAAVMWAAHPDSTAAQIHDQLIGSASILSDTTTTDTTMVGKPMLDLYRAVGGSDSITNPDTVPNDFNIPDITGAVLQGDVTSSKPIIVDGIDSPTPISITNGYYNINGGSFTDAAGVVKKGDSIQVQLHTPATPNTTTQAILTIGGVSKTFSVTTGDPSLAGGFTFPDQTLTQVGTGTDTTESVPQQINNISDGTAISIAGGDYDIGDGADANNITFKGFTNVAGKINNGQWVKVRVPSPIKFAKTAKATLTIGSFKGNFVVHTPRIDRTPDDFTLDHVLDSAAGSLVTSLPFTVKGINTDAFISISGGKYAILPAAGGTPTFKDTIGKVREGDQVEVQLTSSTTPGATKHAMLRIGRVSRLFSVTTHAPDITPDAFSFATKVDASGGSGNTPTLSDTIIIANIDNGTPISVVNGQYAIIDPTNGTTNFTSNAGTINAGQSVQLSATLPAGTSVLTVILTIGDYSTTYTITDGNANTIITPSIQSLAMAPVTNALFNQPVNSNAIDMSVSGITVPSPISVGPGARYSLDGGATFTSLAGTVNPNQSVIVQLTSASTPVSTTTATLTIGGQSSDFTVTTVGVHTVTINPFSNGFASVKTIKVLDGLATEFTLYPDPGYAISGVRLSGDPSCSGSFDAKTNVYKTNPLSGDCSVTVASQQSTPHTISGTVTGLAVNQTLTLTNNDGDSLTITTADANYPNFTFPTQVTSYHVTTSIDITASQICGVNNSSGDSGQADVTNVDVECVAIPRNNIVAGNETSFAIRPDGTLWAWGSNQAGVLGDSNGLQYVPAPEQIGSPNLWINVSSENQHTVAVRSDGTLWAWGANDSGQLGSGDTTAQPVPVEIDKDTHWAMVAAGGYHTLAIKTDGTLWAWGSGRYGEVGDGISHIVGDPPVATPVQIGTDNNWASVSAGFEHSMGIKLDHTLWAWGNDDHGELGDGLKSAVYYDTCGDACYDYVILSPTQIATAQTWANVSAGFYFTVAVDTTGTLWTWGDNSSGQLGINASPTVTASADTPQQISSPYFKASAGYQHALAINCGEGCWIDSWGANGVGQVGDGTVNDWYSPYSIFGSGSPSPSDYVGGPSSAVSAGWYHSLTMDDNGAYWAWGSNANYALGIPIIDPAITSQLTPVQVGDANGFFYHSVGGSVTGLQAGDSVTLQMDSTIAGATGAATSTSTTLTQSTDGPFVFGQALGPVDAYNVTVATQPASGAICSITSGSASSDGTAVNIRDIVIGCK